MTSLYRIEALDQVDGADDGDVTAEHIAPSSRAARMITNNTVSKKRSEVEAESRNSASVSVSSLPLSARRRNNSVLLQLRQTVANTLQRRWYFGCR